MFVPRNCLERKFATLFAAGFSLIELLVVIAIISLLAGLAVPAFHSIGQARGAAEAADRIAASIEFARAEAVSRKTFVWLGIQETTNAGNPALRLGIVCSADGTTNSLPLNLRQLGQPVLVDRVGILPYAQLDVGTNLSQAVDLAGSPGGLDFQIGGTRFASRRTIAFTPLGEAGTNPAPAWPHSFDPVLAIGIRQARGTNLSTNSDIAVAIDGATGFGTILRKN